MPPFAASRFADASHYSPPLLLSIRQEFSLPPRATRYPLEFTKELMPAFSV